MKRSPILTPAPRGTATLVGILKPRAPEATYPAVIRTLAQKVLLLKIDLLMNASPPLLVDESDDRRWFASTDGSDQSGVSRGSPAGAHGYECPPPVCCDPLSRH